MKKRRIVLASVLKPVNDTRMSEKIGVSLAQSGKYEIHIIGYPSETHESHPNIHTHALKKFKRVSIGRIVARLEIIKMNIKVKPELLIVNTHELLVVASLIRILFGTKIIYDLQENYWRNIRFTNAFPKGIRILIASIVRFKEIILSPFITHFILAEKCYSKEMAFVKNKFTVIENKCKVPEGFQRKPSSDFIQLVFTGTMAESTGVFEAIRLAKKLHAIDPTVWLTIIGYCSQPKVLQKIEEEVAQTNFIRLVGGTDLVPHRIIMDTIAAANFGIIYYSLSPHLENKIPTKLFEYLACQLPILLQHHKPWMEMCAPYNAAVLIDFERQDLELIRKEIRSRGFYSKKPEGVTWESEEEKLKTLISSIF